MLVARGWSVVAKGRSVVAKGRGHVLFDARGRLEGVGQTASHGQRTALLCNTKHYDRVSTHTIHSAGFEEFF